MRFVRTLLISALAAVLAGCSVVPQVSGPATPSPSGNLDTSGIAWVHGVGYVNAATRARYNALIGVYGKGIAERAFLPPLVADYGLTLEDANNWQITDQAAIYFGLMSRWQHSAKAGLK